MVQNYQKLVVRHLYTTAINLSSQGNQLLVNGDLNISSTTIIGTGQIVATGNITISSTNVAGDIIIICGGNININGVINIRRNNIIKIL